MRNSAAGIEFGVIAEDLRIGMEAHAGAAPVVDVAEFFQPALRNAAGEALAVELAIARDLDFEHVGQGVDDGDADAVQTARGLVGLAVELAAGMQLGHDHFERRLARNLRMVLDRDAAAVVADREEALRSRWTSMKLAWPATASSIELSMTSANR
jgi:hypothetical protein